MRFWASTAKGTAIGAATVTVLAGLGPSPGLAQPADGVSTARTERVSVTSAGGQVSGTSGAPSISGDGRYVAFISRAPNLVPGDTNGTWDAFVRDRWARTTSRVSVSTREAQGNGQVANDVAISDDGRYVAFESFATNLVPGDTNETSDIFVRDRVAGTTVRVNVSTGGDQATGFNRAMTISATGRYVVFSTDAGNLVAGDTNDFPDIFIRDLLAGTTSLVSVARDGSGANHLSDAPRVTPDGRYVLFTSEATNLVAGDTNGLTDVFLADRRLGTTSRVDVAGNGDEADNGAAGGDVSPDGRHVAFASDATNLVPGDTNGVVDVFLRDRVRGTVRRVSVSNSGVQGNDHSSFITLAADGRYVFFTSDASTLVPGDTNGVTDVFRHDRRTGATRRVSLTDAGRPANNWSGLQSADADGRCVAFLSVASNLVPRDTNNDYDVFTRCVGTGVSFPRGL